MLQVLWEEKCLCNNEETTVLCILLLKVDEIRETEVLAVRKMDQSFGERSYKLRKMCI